MQISIDGYDLVPTAGNTGAAFGNNLDASATGGSFLTTIDPAPAAAAPSDLDPFEDLYGDFGINSWTPAADASLPTGIAASLDTLVDASQSDGIPPPFLNIIGQLDANAYAVDVVGPDQYAYLPADPLGDLANTLDFSLYASGLAPVVDPAILDTWNVAEDILLSPLLLLAGFFA